VPRRLNPLGELPLSRLTEAQIILLDEVKGDKGLAEAIEELIDAKIEAILYPDRAAASVGLGPSKTPPSEASFRSILDGHKVVAGR
jgi:hypothetical protein